MTAGSALNDPCAGCDDEGTQLRYNNTPAGSFAFHQRCHELWQKEPG